jgi:hypothetical protein
MLTIRPAYRHSRFVGFCLFCGEPVGRAMPYKHAALLLGQLRNQT